LGLKKGRFITNQAPFFKNFHSYSSESCQILFLKK
jgi:hypothetical protein